MEHFDNSVWIEIDTYWIAHGGGDPAAWIGQCKGRIPAVHLKDMASDEQRSDLPVGEGTMPWPKLLQAAEEAGVEWYIAEQDNPRDAIEDVRISLQHIRELASE